MMVRIGMLMVLIALCSPAFAQTGTGAAQSVVSTPNQAGKIDLAEGDAKIISAAGTSRAAKVGDVVNEGESVVTGRDGEVHLTMQDTGFIAVRPSTNFQIASYKADGDADDNAVIKLLAGGFRVVTGWIGKHNRSNYRVQTPTATIGVRGTDHEPRYIPDGSSEGQPGTYDKVYAGQTEIQTSAGATTVSPNQAGFVSAKTRERPRLLAAIPRFYVPSKYEVEIAKKHAQIQQMIEQRREERQKVIRAMRADLQKSRQDLKSQVEQNKAAAEQRQQAAEQRRESNTDLRKDIRSETQDALQKRKELQDKRKAFQDDLKAGKLTPEQVQARRRELLEEAKSLQAESKDAQNKRDALKSGNEEALKERVDAAKGDRKALQEKLKDTKGKSTALEHERESAKAETSNLRKHERERYKEEHKAAHRKGGE